MKYKNKGLNKFKIILLANIYYTDKNLRMSVYRLFFKHFVLINLTNT